MTHEELHEQELTYFKLNMLQAEIEMQGMIAENKLAELESGRPIYNEKSFKALIEKYSIHHNAFPFAKH